MINCINQHNVVKVADQPCELLQFTSDESDNEENDEINDSKCNTKCDRSLKPICLNKQRYVNYLIHKIIKAYPHRIALFKMTTMTSFYD